MSFRSLGDSVIPLNVLNPVEIISNKNPKKILLVNPADPWLRNGGDRPSLGTLYLAGWLKFTKAADPYVIDMNHYSGDELMTRIEEVKPDYIGISLTTPQYEEAVKTAARIKTSGYTMPIIAGGPHVTAMQNVPKVPEVMPEAFFDYCIFGAGERTLERICKQGLPNNRIIKGEPMPEGKNLDWLVRPARELVDMKRYTLKIMGKPAQPIMTSFGCPYKCTYCSEPILNHFFKAHSPERVLMEMEELKYNYGAEGLIIYDDVFSIDSRRAMKIADMMIERKLDLVYRCTTRGTDFTRHPDLADKLRESGCVEACIGLESADDDVLSVNDKGMTVEDNRRAIEAIKRSGMKCLTYMITGLPKCTRETEQKSLDFVMDNNVDECGWYLLAPFPSTPLWIDREKYGLEIFEDEIIRNNWDVAQCRADNNQLTCYVDYSKSGGMNRYEIKETWLAMREKLDEWHKRKDMHGIQDHFLEAVK